jgi:hypothetical protein
MESKNYEAPQHAVLSILPLLPPRKTPLSKTMSDISVKKVTSVFTSVNILTSLSGWIRTQYEATTWQSRIIFLSGRQWTHCQTLQIAHAWCKCACHVPLRPLALLFSEAEMVISPWTTENWLLLILWLTLTTARRLLVRKLCCVC